jgi:hypothetical protein
MARLRLRSDFTNLEDMMKAGKVSLGLGALPRGKIYVDSANVSDFADGELVGNILGIPVYRKAALADGKYEYFAEGNLVALLSN